MKNEDDLLFDNNKSLILNGIFSCFTQVQVESCAGFARYLNYIGITRYNYQLFLRILETNNKWVVDALLAEKEARLLFSTIQPNSYIIKKALKILSFWHPSQIYKRVLDALMGILEYSFYKADDGFRIYKLKINDLNNIGKYLDENEDQDEINNRLILDILDKITRLGEYSNDLVKSIIAKHAFYIRIAFFDHRKKLLDVIPQLLLIRMKREDYEIKPSTSFIKYIKESNK